MTNNHAVDDGDLRVQILRREVSGQQETIRELQLRILQLERALATGTDMMPAPMALSSLSSLPSSSLSSLPSMSSSSSLPAPAPRPMEVATFLAPVSVMPTAAEQEGIDFGAVARLSDEAIDGLPFGLLTLDSAGRVLAYNDTESRMSGLPRDRVIGRDFFNEVAPCTRVREFQGRFLELVQNPAQLRVQSFDFVFRFAHSEQQVSIVIVPAKTRGQFRVAMTRRSIVARR